jgi:hypothetical protein
MRHLHARVIGLAVSLAVMFACFVVILGSGCYLEMVSTQWLNKKNFVE